jgi:hypothetical protein
MDKRGLSPNLRWVFRENLCLDLPKPEDKEFRIGFQTRLNPVTEEDVRLVYDQVSRTENPLVFEGLVQAEQFTLCTLLGDPWQVDDDVYVPEWDLYFFLKGPYRLWEEIIDENEWRARKKRESKNLSGLDYVFALKSYKR